jgi:hypothetical protein
MIDRAPRIDPQLLPNQRDATTDDWGPWMIAYGGEPDENDHALLVETVLKISLVIKDTNTLESLHGYRCSRCKVTSALKPKVGAKCIKCWEGTVQLVGNPPWPRPEISGSTLAPTADMIKAEANLRCDKGAQYQWLDEVHARLTASRPDKKNQRSKKQGSGAAPTADSASWVPFTALAPEKDSWAGSGTHQEAPARTAPQWNYQSGASSSWAGSSWEQNSISEKWQAHGEGSNMGAASSWQADSGWETPRGGSAAQDGSERHGWVPSISGSLSKRHRDSRTDLPWDSDSGNQEHGKRTRPCSSSASSLTAPDHWEDRTPWPQAPPYRQ